MPDKDVAQGTGRTVKAVGDRRRLFGIPSFLGYGRKLGRQEPGARRGRRVEG
jgi:hypothetical protein